MTQQIIDVGAAANDGTGEPLRQAFTAVNDNFTQIWTAGPVGSQVQISGNVITTTVTNLGLTLAGNGIGSIQANSTIVPGTPGVYDLGAPNNTFQYIYGDYLVGNGALITGIVANTSYNNSNVAAFLPTYTGNLVSLTGPVRTTANVIAGNIITSGFLGVTGNITGGNITGGNLISSGSVSAVGNITTTANISGNYLLGNGAFITGITATNIAAGALTGTTLSSNVLYSSLKVVDDLLYLSVVGNVTTSGRYIGSGAGLTNIPAANISGQVANALVAGTVYTNAQPNITSVGTLTSLTATGNIAGNYFIGNGALLTGISTSGANANALVGTTLSSNVLYSSLKVVDDLLYLSVVGNVTTDGRYIGSGAGLTNIPAANIIGNVANATYAVTAGTAYSVAGANVVGTVANATYATTAGTATTATTAGTATYANTANSVAGANVTGAVANAVYAVTAGSANTANTATTAGTVTSSAQPNITSVGTLTSVSVAGNATLGNILTSGKISAAGNITGNYFIGNGALLTGVAAANVYANALIGDVLSSNVLYSSLKVVDDLLYLSVVGNVTIAGQFVGSGAGLTNVPGANVTGNVANANYATTAGTATTATYANTANSVAGANVTGTVANATYATTSGSATTAGTVTTAAQPNITSVGTLTSVTVAGDTIGGNLLTSGRVSATGNITGNYFVGNGRQLTGIVATEVGVLPSLSVTGNTVTGNLSTGGTISAVGNIKTTGNITGNYFVGNGALLTGITVAAGTSIVNGNSNVNVGANGNVTVSTAGISNVAVFDPTGVSIAGVISATGNVAGNYLLGNGALITGLPAGYSNADVANYLPTYSGNLVSLTGPVTTTSNITGGNVLTDGIISATGNIIGGNVNTNNIQPITGELTISTATGNLNLQPVGNVVLSNTIISGVAYPQQDQDAASKIYVDNMVSTGINYHSPVAAATTTTLATATGGTITYTQPNGVSNGVGAYLSTTGSFNLIDTANVQTAGTRILVKNEANAVYNGVYTWSNATVIVRSTDTDQYGPDSTEDLSLNDYFFVQGGDVNKGGAWVVSAPAGTITFGTSNITFSQFSSSQTYTANTAAGISLIGTQINARVDQNTTAFDVGGNIIVKAGANLTTPNIGAATGTSLSVTSNVTGGNVLTGGVVSATANITGGNLLTAGVVSAVSTITGGNLATGGTVTATGNVTGGNVLTGGVISATSTITSAANITGGNILTGGVISATSNITTGANVNANNITATTIVNAPSLTGTIASLSGNVTGGNVLTGGAVSAVGNIDGGNLLTIGAVSATGNVYGDAILSDNYYYANGTPVPPGVVYTAAVAPPPTPKITDQWYNTASDVLYEYIDDGTSTYWVDTTSPAFAGGVVANVAISGTLVPIANVTYDIGTSTVYFRNTYTQNLYTNNRLPANNMPLGAVVQTVMSSSLGGSITNSTSYADINYANVTIVPSSATSRVLILATGTSSFTSLSGQDVAADTQLVRSPSTSLQIQTSGTTLSGGGIGVTGAVSYSYLDSPGTTSAVTYKLQQKVSNSSSTLTSTNIWLIAMEIAAS